MKIADGWVDYQIIACGNGQKLERWGSVYLLRPDPQAIWETDFDFKGFSRLNARYERSSSGGGAWQILKPFDEQWSIGYGGKWQFFIRPTGFKHTGLFPEQSVNWDTLSALVLKRLQSKKTDVKILNLFGYTGAATAALAHSGAFVTHVDAAKGMVERCKDNCRLNSVLQNRVRYIVDDCEKFVQRELRRGNKYDGILMDPPSYGRGPNGEMWRLEDNVFGLVKNAVKLLGDNPLFFLINSYTTGLQPATLRNILSLNVSGASVSAFEVCLPCDDKKIVLPCGCSALAEF